MDAGAGASEAGTCSRAHPHLAEPPVGADGVFLWVLYGMSMGVRAGAGLGLLVHAMGDAALVSAAVRGRGHGATRDGVTQQ